MLRLFFLSDEFKRPVCIAFVGLRWKQWRPLIDVQFNRFFYDAAWLCEFFLFFITMTSHQEDSGTIPDLTLIFLNPPHNFHVGRGCLY